MKATAQNGVQRILLVDDHELVRSALETTVQSLFPQAAINQAGTFDEAMAHLQSTRPDMVILDLKIPGGSGLDAIHRMTAIHPGILILVLSGLDELEYGVPAVRAGAHGFISKNAPATAITEAIRNVAQGRKSIPSAVSDRLIKLLGHSNGKRPHECLSTRELEIMEGVASGKTPKEIAYDLHISPKTVATYVSRIYEKTGLDSYVGITRYALHHGLVD